MVYLDTNVLIYLLENHPEYGRQTAKKLATLKTEGQSFVASTILVTEFLGGSIGTSFRDLLRVSDLVFQDVSLEIAQNAAVYQRKDGLVIGDALHLATATKLSQVSALFTYDKQLAGAAAKYLKVITA